MGKRLDGGIGSAVNGRYEHLASTGISGGCHLQRHATSTCNDAQGLGLFGYS